MIEESMKRHGEEGEGVYGGINDSVISYSRKAFTPKLKKN